MYDTSAYWSESQKQFVQVADMPMPYVKNVYNKLSREDPENFAGSMLHRALLDRLCPSRAVAKSLLATKGECSYFWPEDIDPTRCRRFFYSIGKALGVKVHTEKKKDFIHATCEPVGEKIIVNVIRDNKSKTFGR